MDTTQEVVSDETDPLSTSPTFDLKEFETGKVVWARNGKNMWWPAKVSFFTVITMITTILH